MDNIKEQFKKKSFILLFSMAISSIAIIVLNTLVQISGIRFELAIAPILSLLWGPYAIIGFIIPESIIILISNPERIADIIFIDLIIYICNFAVWKLWYSTMNKYGITVPHLGSVYNLLKFIFICLAYPILTYALFDLFINANIIHLKIIGKFLVTFPLSFLGLIISIYLVNKHKISMYSPKRQFRKILPKKAYPILLFIFFALVAIVHFISKNSYLAHALEIVCFLSLIIYLMKPYDYDIHKIKDYVKLNIFFKVNISLLMDVLVIIFLISILPYFFNVIVFELSQDTLYDILSIVFILMVIMVIPALLYMYFMENYMTKPINKLSETLIYEISNREEYLKHKSELESINVNNEIRTLVDSLLKMENKLIEYGENLIKLTSEKERYETELRLGSEIQYSMIPRDFEEFHEEFDGMDKNKIDFELCGEMKAAREVGGDFYDYFKIDDETIGFSVGDVCGKGVSAALIMVKAMTLIQNYAKEYDDLSKVFYEVNNLIYEDNSEELSVKSFLGEINLNSGELTFVNAGYEQPLIRLNEKTHDFTTDIMESNDHEGNFEYVKDYNNPNLSIMKDTRYETHTIKLDKEDAIFLYSDSILETISESNEMYGKERLKNALNKNKDGDLSFIIESIEKDLKEFSNHNEQIDDVTMFIIQLK